MQGILDPRTAQDIANTAVQFAKGDVEKMLSYSGEKDILNPKKTTLPAD
jgi:hypothetical protein